LSDTRHGQARLFANTHAESIEMVGSTALIPGSWIKGKREREKKREKRYNAEVYVRELSQFQTVSRDSILRGWKSGVSVQ